MRSGARWALQCALVVIAPWNFLGAPTVHAQEPRTSNRTADTTAAARARIALRDLERVETGLAVRRDTTDLGRRSEQQRRLTATRLALDTAILVAPNGRRTLAILQREYPGAAILREYEAWRLLADGEPDEALVRFDGLLRASRRNVSLLRGRARALDALHREPDATEAWERAMDAEPASAEAFDALWKRHQAAGSLGTLHRTIARLRLMHPADTVLLGHEVRVLQGLGLPDSAAAIVRRFTGGK